MMAGGVKLEEGKIYTFARKEPSVQGRKIKIRKERWRLLKCYPHHAQFENQFGTKRSFGYWDIGRMLNGGSME